MNTAQAVQNSTPTDIMESVIVKGDLSKLTSDERVKYYNAVCRSVGLNPLTQPFAFMNLSGKYILYAKRDATDQLRTLHNVSVDDVTEAVREGVYIVTCKVRDGKGRTDVSKGAVSITGLKGDALANAMMKAETKAKRRATLSIVGLGFLDETEMDTIPDAASVEMEPPTESIDRGVQPYKLPAHAEFRPWAKELIDAIRNTKSDEEIQAWLDANENALLDMREVEPKLHRQFTEAVELHRNAINR